MSTLDNTVRKKLIETKNSKKNLIKEESIIKTRLKLISESNQLKTKKDLDKFSDDLLNEIFYMHSQDFNKVIIQESLLEFIKGMFGSSPKGIWEYINERFAHWLLGSVLGLPDGFLRRAIATWWGNLDLSEMSKMLSDCSLLVRSLTKSMTEAYADKLIDEKFGDKPFYDILRNTFIEQLEKGKLDDVFYNTLSAVICPALNGIMPKMDNLKNVLKGGALSSLGTKPA